MGLTILLASEQMATSVQSLVVTNVAGTSIDTGKYDEFKGE
jgi:hypothetical protein